jgi:hypothetical protein
LKAVHTARLERNESGSMMVRLRHLGTRQEKLLGLNEIGGGMKAS